FKTLQIELEQALFEPPYIQISLIILLEAANRDRITDSLIIHQRNPPKSILIPIIKVQPLFRTHPQSIFTIKIGAKDQAAVQGCGILHNLFTALTSKHYKRVSPQPIIPYRYKT